MIFTSALMDFGIWWLAEAKGAMPSRLSTGKVTVDCVLAVGLGSVRLESISGDCAIQSSFADLDRHLKDLKADRNDPLKVEIVLEPGRCLARPLSALQLPMSRAREMARIDLTNSTPLDPAESIVLLPRHHARENGSRYFVVKRGFLQSLIDAIARVEGRLVSVKAQSAEGLIELEPADYRHLASRGKRSGLVRKLQLVLLAASVAAMVGTYAHAQWRYAASLSELDAQIGAVETDAKEVRSLLEKRKQQVRQIADVRAQKQQTVPVVRIWDELSRAIPDTSWASDLSITTDKVRVTGFAQSAAGLIVTLEASQLFSGPTFSAPVVKAPEQDKERFAIDMELER